MKTAMKRLLSFVLVAMMLVSVVPFQASADQYSTVKSKEDHYLVDPESDIAAHIAYVRGEEGLSAEEYPDSLAKMYLANGTEPEDNAALTVYNRDTDPMGFYVEFKKLTHVTVSGTITYGSESETFTYEVPVGEKLTVGQVLTDEGFSGDQYESNPVASTELTGTGNTITVTNKQAPTQVVLKYLPAGSNVPSAVAADFTQETTLMLGENGKVNSFIAGENVTYNNKVYVVNSWNSQPDGKGTDLVTGSYLKYNSPTVYYAQYDVQNLDLNSVKFYAVPVVDGIPQDADRLSYSLELGKNEALASALSTDAVKADLQAALEAEGYDPSLYTWDAGTYYVNSGVTTGLPTTDKVGSGRNIYLKLKYEGDNIVLVYPHKSYNDNPDPIQMLGYAYGDDVDKDDVIKAVKKRYSVSSSNVHGLYDQRDWNQVEELKKTIDGKPSIRVDEEKTVIHVWMKNAYSTTADDSNPKTGDTILMAVTALGISASALAVLYFYNKKKQSV